LFHAASSKSISAAPGAANVPDDKKVPPTAGEHVNVPNRRHSDSEKLSLLLSLAQRKKDNLIKTINQNESLPFFPLHFIPLVTTL